MSALFGSWSPFPDLSSATSTQVAFLVGVYGYGIKQATQLLSEASEDLLLVAPVATFFGAVILPLLCAVPDCLLVFLSTAGEANQESVQAGVGVLVGSSLGLLLLPTTAALFGGRVPIKNGVALYGSAMPSEQLDTSQASEGVGFHVSVRRGAKLMLASTAGYWLLELGRVVDVDFFNVLAWPICFLCFGALVYVLMLLWEEAKKDRHGDTFLDEQIAEAAMEALRQGKLSLSGVAASLRQRKWEGLCRGEDVQQTLLSWEAIAEVRRFCSVLTPFFHKQDIDCDGKINFEEFRLACQELREEISRPLQLKLFESAAQADSGLLSLQDFVACMMSYATDPVEDLEASLPREPPQGSLRLVAGKTCELEEEAHSLAATWQQESQELQSWRRSSRSWEVSALAGSATWKLLSGLVVCITFAGPLVESFVEVGTRLEVSPTVPGLLLAPLFTGLVDETAAAFRLAQRRSKRSLAAAWRPAIRGVLVNNTLGLALLLIGMRLHGLAWNFDVEVVVLLLAEGFMACVVVQKESLKVLEGISLLALYLVALTSIMTLRHGAASPV